MCVCGGGLNFLLGFSQFILHSRVAEQNRDGTIQQNFLIDLVYFI